MSGRVMRRNNVRQLRIDRLLTQIELANRAKVSLRTIHGIEKGADCRMDTKRKLVLALGFKFSQRHEVFPPPPANAP